MIDINIADAETEVKLKGFLDIDIDAVAGFVS